MPSDQDSIPASTLNGLFDRSTAFMLVLFTLITRLYVLIRVPDYAYEDALITLRMTVNAALGHNLIYNLGERALGTTTPLFAWLMVPAHWVTSDSFHFLIVVRSACIAMDLMSVWLLYKLVSRYQPWVALVTGLLFACYPSVVFQAETGMETSLYILLIWSSLFCLDRGYIVRLGILCGLILWCRPDGLILIVVALTYLVWQKKFKECIVLAGVAAVTLLPWTLYSTWYYGSVIPSSLTSKIFTYGHHRKLFDNLPIMIKQVILGVYWHRLPLLLLSVYALIRIPFDLQRYRHLVAPLLWVIVYFGAFSAGRTVLFPWYLFPIYPFYFLAALAGLAMLVEKYAPAALAEKLVKLYSNTGLRYTLWTAVIVSGVLLQTGLVRDMSRGTEEERVGRKALALYMKTLAKPGDVAMMEPIGYIGYYSELRVLDVIGLVSPEITKESVAWPNNFGVLAEKYKPRFAILRTGEYNNPNNVYVQKNYHILKSGYAEFYLLERNP